MIENIAEIYVDKLPRTCANCPMLAGMGPNRHCVLLQGILYKRSIIRTRHKHCPLKELSTQQIAVARLKSGIEMFNHGLDKYFKFASCTLYEKTNAEDSWEESELTVIDLLIYGDWELSRDTPYSYGDFWSARSAARIGRTVTIQVKGAQAILVFDDNTYKLVTEEHDEIPLTDEHFDGVWKLWRR